MQSNSLLRRTLSLISLAPGKNDKWRTSSPTYSDRIDSPLHPANTGALVGSRQRLPACASLSHPKIVGSPAHRGWRCPVQFSPSAFPRIAGTRYVWTDSFRSGSFLSGAASQQPVKGQQAKSLRSRSSRPPRHHGALKSTDHTWLAATAAGSGWRTVPRFRPRLRRSDSFSSTYSR